MPTSRACPARWRRSCASSSSSTRACSGTITLYSEDPLTPNEAYLNFLAALRGLGFTVVEVGGLFKVVPEADAKLQAGTVSVDGVSRRGDQVITQIFRLNHENANNLVPVLRPLITPEQHDQRQPGQQHAGDHRLRRQPAAAGADHRRAWTRRPPATSR